jgi:hypothetical protein
MAAVWGWIRALLARLQGTAENLSAADTAVSGAVPPQGWYR